jgi:predicted ribosomally synthesized peptide with nif11-like leader
MSKTLEDFYQVVVKDIALQDEIGGAGSREEMIAAAVKLGASRGFSFSADDVSAKLASLEKAGGAGELSDAQLAGVAGGAVSLGSSILCGYCGSQSGTSERHKSGATRAQRAT